MTRFVAMTEPEIAAALRNIHESQPTLPSRVETVSSAFIGTPYKLGCLGEGDGAPFDRDPVYSFRHADCTTSVEQVMALALTGDLEKALHDTLQRIRYKDGRIGYETRNHFIEADWIPNNAAAGFLEDITEAVAGPKTKRLRKLVCKRDWYAQRTLDDIQGFPSTTPGSEKEKRIKDLQALGARFADQETLTPYLPMDQLETLMPKLPSGTIANLVREDRPGKPTIISHQVLLIGKKGKFVRHAASGKEYLDVPALEYFRSCSGSSWKPLGVNLNAIREP
ncbi:MAG: DUF1460 domain-containing protein [Elusimicrobia bacterium]|nr:DUF1460 domain-containing protein [Elusimicrobiota bacterium]